MLADDRRVGSVERQLHLRKSTLVGTLHPQLLAVLADAARPRVFRKGQPLLVEGEPVEAARFVVEGRLHLERNGAVVGHGEPGTSLGEIGMIARAPATVTARAETDVLVLELDADTCVDLLEDHFGILRHFLREICGRIIDDWQRLPAGTPLLMAKPLLMPTASDVRDLDLVDRIFQLRQFSTLDRASIGALSELARGLSELHLEPGTPLWAEGEPARHVLLVLAGQAEGHARNGFRVEVGPGAAMGVLEAIAGRPRWYEARVSAPLTALTSDIEALLDIFEDNLDMALGFLTAMSRWLLLLTDRLAEPGADLRGRGLSGYDVTRIDPSPEGETEPTL
jgi:CRP-like cAMP-binding protein